MIHTVAVKLMPPLSFFLKPMLGGCLFSRIPKPSSSCSISFLWRRGFSTSSTIKIRLQVRATKIKIDCCTVGEWIRIDVFVPYQFLFCITFYFCPPLKYQRMSSLASIKLKLVFKQVCQKLHIVKPKQNVLFIGIIEQVFHFWCST